MTNICNRLDKLVPPPFITANSENIASIWKYWKIFKEVSKYEINGQFLISEIEFLNGFIGRKGQQLRLEKALLLTTQILKLSQRWKTNDYLQQFKKFSDAFGTNHPINNRFPTKKWGHWILYLFLREIAILAKMKLECEIATKYWLGLIGAQHYWGDSLIATGILSRIWYLSCLIINESVNSSYELLLKVVSSLPNTNSSNWPSENWIPPSNLHDFLENTMKLSYVQPRLKINLAHLDGNYLSNQSQLLGILNRTFIDNKISSSPASPKVEEDGKNPILDQIIPKDQNVFQESTNLCSLTEIEEDLGIVATENHQIQEDAENGTSSDGVSLNKRRTRKRAGKRRKRVKQVPLADGTDKINCTSEIEDDAGSVSVESEVKPPSRKRKRVNEKEEIVENKQKKDYATNQVANSTVKEKTGTPEALKNVQTTKIFRTKSLKLLNNGKWKSLLQLLTNFEKKNAYRSSKLQQKLKQLIKLVRRSIRTESIDNLKIRKHLTSFNTMLAKRKSENKLLSC